MRTASAQMMGPASPGSLRTARVHVDDGRSVSFEGVAVTGRVANVMVANVIRILGLVLLLILAILPG